MRNRSRLLWILPYAFTECAEVLFEVPETDYRWGTTSTNRSGRRMRKTNTLKQSKHRFNYPIRRTWKKSRMSWANRVIWSASNHWRTKKKKVSKPHRFRSTDGTSILVGKNNLQNDQLTLKTAKKDGYLVACQKYPWFARHHREQQPEWGNDNGKPPTLRLLFQIPELSQCSGRLCGRQAHPQTEWRKKPGFVIYEGQKTVYVTPDKELIKSLKADWCARKRRYRLGYRESVPFFLENHYLMIPMLSDNHSESDNHNTFTRKLVR